MSGLKSLKKQRRIQFVVIAGVAVLAVVGLLFTLPDDTFQYYRSPSEVTEAPPNPRETFRMGGLVADGSILRGEGAEIRFVVTDGAAEIPVSYVGIVPDLFEENQGVVARGSFDGTLFTATEIEAKHDEDYLPKEVVDSLKEQGVYVAPDAQEGGS